MGEVFRARDTRLGRDVALKVLPDALAADADRLMRFEREARTLAALNHPHIAQVYGLEELPPGAETGGGRALVLELVDGEDPSTRIARGPIPTEEALPIARQIADALDAAHEQGIIHRDLKPANVKVRADGTVKVLDFGLAKTLDPADGGASSGAGHVLAHSPTITSPAMTRVGVILGTAAYMAPEQAKGRPATKRSDIWAFGCVLFEMLTGRRAFEGEDISDTLANILKGEPDWSRLPGTTPAAIVRLLRRCLVREARQRLADSPTRGSSWMRPAILARARRRTRLGHHSATHHGASAGSGSSDCSSPARSVGCSPGLVHQTMRRLSCGWIS